jgi:nucleotide-binding universal stress UspA family protein
MIPPKTILYPINLESKKILILNRIFLMAKKFGASIHILFVNDDQAGYRHAQKTEVDVKTAVTGLTNPQLLEGLNIFYHVARGELGEEVRKFSEANKIELIITGHKHRNRLYTSLFDTPEESIIDAVSVPVLVIPKKIAEQETELMNLD